MSERYPMLKYWPALRCTLETGLAGGKHLVIWEKGRAPVKNSPPGWLSVDDHLALLSFLALAMACFSALTFSSATFTRCRS